MLKQETYHDTNHQIWASLSKSEMHAEMLHLRWKPLHHI
jgi:hypothetical protein